NGDSPVPSCLLPSRRPLGGQRLQPRNVLPQLPQLLNALALPHRHLEAQPEQLVPELRLPRLQLLVAHLPQALDRGPRAGVLRCALHCSSPPRLTNRVFSASLWLASRIASAACASGTPSISNRIRPGFTTATQWSGAPLPLPIRVSAGFLVTGLSGNTRTHTLPPRFTKRVIATRLASIWRSVIQPGSSTFRPKSPNDSSPPVHALPDMRPRCCLRNLTFLGINIATTW